MLYQFPNEIKSNLQGYNTLIDFYCIASELTFKEIILDFGKTNFLEANLSAILGAILGRLKSNLNEIRITNLSDSVKPILQKNHFLSHFDGYILPDMYGSTIKYRKFKTTEEKLFKDYLDRELLSRSALPDMSLKLRKKINESIFEIFNNAVIHGDCDCVFSCGQYYPRKKTLAFTVVDLGISIKENVNNYLNENFTGEVAINWAAEKKIRQKEAIFQVDLV